jgi:hypothetical protein
MTDKDHLARNLAEAIDGLYRQTAAPRDHARLVGLGDREGYARGYARGRQEIEEAAE